MASILVAIPLTGWLIMPTPAKPVPLCDLCVGETARFHECRLDSSMARFLRALGLTRSCEFRVCQNGEPCIVQVRSTRIGLSRAVAGQIYVLPVPDQSV
jgi:Fe2+ transport system protein FeoA